MLGEGPGGQSNYSFENKNSSVLNEGPWGQSNKLLPDVGHVILILKKKVEIFNNTEGAVMRNILQKKQGELEEGYYVTELANIEEDVYAVNVPSKEHGRPNVIKTKEVDINTLLNFGTIDEIKDGGKDMISSK